MPPYALLRCRVMDAVPDGSPVSRRQFLRGAPGAGPAPIRPPWAVPGSRFAEQCTACRACVDACPERILSVGAGDYPQVDFRRGECTFCAACVEACEPGALGYGEVPWSNVAGIAATCLTYQGVVCRSCADQCEPAAIIMKLLAGGVALPELHRDACTGCGACVRVCPVSAITITQQGSDQSA